MFKLFQLLLFLIVPIFFALLAFRVVARALSHVAFNPGSAQGGAKIQDLRAKLQEVATGALHPWDAESLGLLSLKVQYSKKPGWTDRTATGAIVSIYQEPLIAFARAEAGRDKLTLARTSAHEFLLRHKGKETEIWIDDKPYAVYFDGSLLESGKNSRLIARLEAPSDEEHAAILIGTTEAAMMNNPKRMVNPNPRAFSLLCQCSPEDEKAILAIYLAKLL